MTLSMRSGSLTYESRRRRLGGPAMTHARASEGSGLSSRSKRIAVATGWKSREEGDSAVMEG